MVAQPEKDQGLSPEYINPSTRVTLLGKEREGLVLRFRSSEVSKNLTHSVYEPLWTLIRSLAAILVVDKHRLPESNVRKRPEIHLRSISALNHSI